MEIYLTIVGAVQIYLSYVLWVKIKAYRQIVISGEQIDIEILEKADSENYTYETFRTYQIVSDNSTPQFQFVKNTINGYLKRNQGVVTDISAFENIIKRVIQRTESEILFLVKLPFYIGLLGAVLGISIALFQDHFSHILFAGLKYGLLLPVAGALLSIFFLGYSFRLAKYSLDTKVTDLLNMLEVCLLPELKADISSNLQRLYQNLAHFNIGLTEGTVKLENVLNKNHTSLIEQSKIIEGLDKLNIVENVQFNAEVFANLQQILPQFELLGEYVAGLNKSFRLSNNLTSSLTNILDRTEAIGDIVSHLRNSSEMAVNLNKIVEDYFEAFEDRAQTLTLATTSMEDDAKLTVDHFKGFVKAQIDALKEITLKEEDLLIAAFNKNRDVLGKLNELSEIKTAIKTLADRPVVGFEASADRIIASIEGRRWQSSKNSWNIKEALSRLMKKVFGSNG